MAAARTTFSNRVIPAELPGAARLAEGGGADRGSYRTAAC